MNWIDASRIHRFFLLVGMLGALLISIDARGQAQQAAVNRVVSQSPTIVKPPSAIPNLYILGDSAAAKSSAGGVDGWGTPFAAFFDPAKMNVVNSSTDNASTRISLVEAEEEKFVAQLCIGDFVLIQLNQNDADDVKDTAGRGSLRGLGDETEQVMRDGKTEFVHSYGWYMRDAIGRIRAAGATPIVLTGAKAAVNADAIAVAKQVYAPLLEIQGGPAEAANVLGSLKTLQGAAFDKYLNDTGKAVARADAKLVAANALPGTEPNPNSKLDLQPFEYHGNLPGNDPQWDSPTTPKTGKVVLALAGDSTVTYTQGYAAGFKSHLDKKLQVIDFSRGGATTSSFRAQSRWDWVIALKPDYVMIQFGHNDGARNLPLYSSDLGRFVDEARAAGIKPILVTPIARRYFEADGKIHSDLLQNVDAMKKVAAEKNVLLMDLHQASINFYEKVGKPVTDTWGLKKANPDLRTAPNPDAIAQKVLDKTHFNPNGSMAIGKTVSDELKRAVPELATYIE